MASDKKVVILQTKNCRIHLEGAKYVLMMKMAKGNKWIQNAPFDGDLRGLMAALTLSLDVISGKVWPAEIIDDIYESKPDLIMIENNNQKGAF